ncbi:MAG: hypothetical protein M1833_003656 [Piccolia ochrophora]|nr:MAG: hypothetical protein M1833_003656 [Piccolia ochrophora]
MHLDTTPLLPGAGERLPKPPATDKALPCPPIAFVSSTDKIGPARSLIDCSEKSLDQAAESWPTLVPKSAEKMHDAKSPSEKTMDLARPVERYPRLYSQGPGGNAGQPLNVFEQSERPIMQRKPVKKDNLQARGTPLNRVLATAAGAHGILGTAPVVRTDHAAKEMASADKPRNFSLPRQTRTSSLRARLSAGRLTREGSGSVRPAGLNDVSLGEERIENVGWKQVRPSKSSGDPDYDSPPMNQTQSQAKLHGRIPTQKIAGSRRAETRRQGSRSTNDRSALRISARQRLTLQGTQLVQRDVTNEYGGPTEGKVRSGMGNPSDTRESAGGSSKDLNSVAPWRSKQLSNGPTLKISKSADRVIMGDPSFDKENRKFEHPRPHTFSGIAGLRPHSRVHDDRQRKSKSLQICGPVSGDTALRSDDLENAARNLTPVIGSRPKSSISMSPIGPAAVTESSSNPQSADMLSSFVGPDGAANALDGEVLEDHSQKRSAFALGSGRSALTLTKRGSLGSGSRGCDGSVEEYLQDAQQSFAASLHTQRPPPPEIRGTSFGSAKPEIGQPDSPSPTSRMRTASTSPSPSAKHVATLRSRDSPSRQSQLRVVSSPGSSRAEPHGRALTSNRSSSGDSNKRSKLSISGFKGLFKSSKGSSPTASPFGSPALHEYGIAASHDKFASSPIFQLDSQEITRTTTLAMQILDSARNEANSPRKQQLLELGKVMVDAITNARDAERAMEQAKIAAGKAEMAFAMTAKAVVDITQFVSQWSEVKNQS